MTIDCYSPSLLARLALLEKRICYTFKDKTLLATSMTHSSWANEHRLEHNERLEFLGDAVLELNISHEIFRRYPGQREGVMTSLRSRLVSEESLASIAKSLDLGTYLLMGKGEEAQGGRERPALLADALEALFGAIFLDGGHASASAVIQGMFESLWPATAMPPKDKDYKTRLQEETQARLHSLPVYVQLESRGPAHAKEFIIRLELSNGKSYQASGGSLKKAEQTAAKMALDDLRSLRETEPYGLHSPSDKT